jgi:hypothetical protein
MRTLSTEKRNHPSQVLWTLRLQDMRNVSTQVKGPEKEDPVLTSFMQEYFKFRARTRCHSHKHTGQGWWASRICSSEQIWSLDGFNARRTLMFDQSPNLDLPHSSQVDKNFVSWISTYPFYVKTSKKSYTWSNNKVLMTDHAEFALQKCVYGPKQSIMECYLRISNFLKSIGLEICS